MVLGKSLMMQGVAAIVRAAASGTRRAP